jgi:hypothetical protein
MTKFLSLFRKHKCLYILEKCDNSFGLSIREYDDDIKEDHIWCSLVKYLLPSNEYLKKLKLVQNAAGIIWFEPLEEEVTEELRVYAIGDYDVFILADKYIVHLQKSSEPFADLFDDGNVDDYIESIHQASKEDYSGIFDEAKKKMEADPVLYNNLCDAVMSLEGKLTESDYTKYQEEIDSLFDSAAPELDGLVAELETAIDGGTDGHHNTDDESNEYPVEDPTEYVPDQECEVGEVESREVADADEVESREVAEVESREVADADEVESREVAEVESREVAEVESREVAEVESREVADADEVESREVAEVESREVAEVESREVAEVTDVDEVESREVAEDVQLPHYSQDECAETCGRKDDECDEVCGHIEDCANECYNHVIICGKSDDNLEVSDIV